MKYMIALYDRFIGYQCSDWHESRQPEKIMPALENEPTSFVAEEPGPTTTQTLHDIRSAMEGRNFGSREEAQTFAREIHAEFSDFPYRPNFKIISEENDSKLMALRRFLGMCGLIKKQHQKFSLTRKGQHLVEKGFEAQHFLVLLKNYMLKYNWGYRDRYPEIGIIQQSVIFSCYLLHRKAGGVIHTDELGDCFIRAYPLVLDTLKDYRPYDSPEQTLPTVHI